MVSDLENQDEKDNLKTNKKAFGNLKSNNADQ